MFKIGLVRPVRLIVYDCVALVVEAGRRLGQVWSEFGMRRWCRGDCARIRRAGDEKSVRPSKATPIKIFMALSLGLIAGKSMPVLAERQIRSEG